MLFKNLLQSPNLNSAQPQFRRVFKRLYVARGVKMHLAFVPFGAQIKLALKLADYGIARVNEPSFAPKIALQSLA